MSDTKVYVVDYPFQGARWGAEIKASSFAEAQQRIEAMGAFGRVQGELMAKVPGTLGPVVRLVVWVRNLVRP